MNSYFILQKDEMFVAVDTMSSTVAEEIEALIADDYFVCSDSFWANNSNDAVLRWKDKAGKGPKPITYKSNYETAIFVSGIITFVGWLVVAIGILVTGFGLASLSKMYSINFASFIGVAVPGIGGIISGLFLVAVGQVVKATVDNADHTRQILNRLG